MKTNKNFRPRLTDRLEDRTVPTGFGDGSLGSLIGSLPAKDARLVAQAFQRFDLTYVQDVQSTLYHGAAPTAATRAAFDTQIGQALNDLNTAVDSAISNLGSSTLAGNISAVLLGPGKTTLQTELQGLATPTSGSLRNEIKFIGSSFGLILPATTNVVNQVQNAPAPSGSISVQAVQTDLSTINTAFQTFTQSYNKAVQTDLASAAPSATQFKTDVTTALTTLNTAVTGALSNLPASVASSLSTSLTNSLLSNTTVTTNLQDTLAGFTVPTNGNRFSLFILRLQSGFATRSAQGQVVQQFIAAVAKYNSTLA